MKAPRFHSRSKNRQNFNVTSAGFFSVLKTAPRTVTVRPAAGYRSLVVPSSTQEISAESSEQFADRLSTTRIPLVGEVGMMDRGLARMGLIVLSAASFTAFILWWMMGLRH